jgi:hypothetical protein
MEEKLSNQFIHFPTIWKYFVSNDQTRRYEVDIDVWSALDGIVDLCWELG